MEENKLTYKEAMAEIDLRHDFQPGRLPEHDRRCGERQGKAGIGIDCFL